MANQENLKPWKPGESGNPAGKPKGTKHLSTWIQEAMEDELFVTELSNGEKYKGAPVQALVKSLICKALNGELKAFELLAKFGYGTKIDVTSKDEKLPIPILGGITSLNQTQIEQLYKERLQREYIKP